jgi:RNA polymerase sigma factor (sigma-70 family)
MNATAKPFPTTRDAESIATRHSLLERLKNWDDQSSWQEFFNTYWKLIYSVGIKAGLSDIEAQDVVQETVISVARKIEGFVYDPAVCSFKTWMLRLTRWRIINQMNKRQRESGVFAALDANGTGTALLERIPDPVSLNVDAIWEEEWSRSRFAAALERVKQQVNPEQFQLFDLYVIEQWPVQKVAHTLGVSAGRVYLAKHRISRLLKKEMKRLEASNQ